jgi:hypothetical protein
LGLWLWKEKSGWNSLYSGYIAGSRFSSDPSNSDGQQIPTKGNQHAPAARGLVRVEVQAHKKDADLIRTLAEMLHSDADKAEALRSVLAKALIHPKVQTAFDVFGSELSDEVFAGVFDTPRQRGWREAKL